MHTLWAIPIRLVLYSLTSVCLLAVAAQSCLGAPVAQKKVLVWKLDQISHIYSRFTLLIGDSCIKLILPKQNIVCVSCAPSWKAVIVNNDDKVGMEYSKDRWRSIGLPICDKMVGQVLKWRKAATWQGLPAIRTESTVQGDPLREQYEMLYRNGAERALEISSEEVLYAKWITLTPPVQDFLTGMYRVFDFPGPMLQRVRIYSNNKRDVVIDTFKCTHTQVDASEFTYPTQFKKVNDIRLVTGDKHKRKQAADLVQDLLIPGSP